MTQPDQTPSQATPTTVASSPVAHEMQKIGNDLVLSFMALRQFLGYLGLLLPVSLLIYATASGRGLEPSISDFYYSPMGDVLVGILSAIGVFFLCYKGFKPLNGEWITDRRVSLVAGVSVLGVAMFPVHRTGQPPCLPHLPDCITFGASGHPNLVHFGSAALFFVSLALFCLVLFTRGDRRPDGRLIWTPRNMFYTACGIIIAGALLALLPYVAGSIPFRARLDAINYVFWCETAGVLAFAASWLVKGRALDTLKDVGAKVSESLNTPGS